MYRVTYQNTLKKGKNLTDFQNWLSVFWAVQQTWGADSVKFWLERNGSREHVMCQYLVRDIQVWNRLAVEQDASDLVRELENIVKTDKITIDRIADGQKEVPFNQ
ncbi:hypothetical protein JW906_07765 [bacterium]|nr:hypothetical protein [bacterium]